MLKRKENGGLALRELDLRIFFDDLFVKCRTEREIEWLHEQITGASEIAMEERLYSIEKENKEDKNG